MSDRFSGDISFPLKYVLAFPEAVECIDYYSGGLFKKDLKEIKKCLHNRVSFEDQDGDCNFCIECSGIFFMNNCYVPYGEFEDLVSFLQGHSIPYDAHSAADCGYDEKAYKYRPNFNGEPLFRGHSNPDYIYLNIIKRILNLELSDTKKIDLIKDAVTDIDMSDIISLEKWLDENPYAAWLKNVKKQKIFNQMV